MVADIREAVSGDSEDIARIAGESALFPPELVEELLAPALAHTREGGIWWVASRADRVCGLAWVRPEPLTESTWNLVALAVAPDGRGSGIGRALLRQAESSAWAAGATILLIETSSSDAQAPARQLYEAAGYLLEGRIRDYWAPADDKIIFSKRATRDGPPVSHTRPAISRDPGGSD